MRPILRLLGLGLLLVAPLWAHAQGPIVGATIAGTPTISDGDTLRIGDTRIRLHGIDAPETDQYCHNNGGFVPCGTWATQALTRLIDASPVSCTVEDIDRYGRAVATCLSVHQTNLSAAMAHSGWAVAMPRYSDAYVPYAAEARANRAGLWGLDDFHLPSDWRRGARW